MSGSSQRPETSGPRRRLAWVALGTAVAFIALLWLLRSLRPVDESAAAVGREEVVFWHFWGGADRAVVEQIVARFNAQQSRWHVRAVAMPGNNLDLKVFLSVAGGSPPDLINQDDPIVAEWALRGAIEPLDAVASPEQLERLQAWLFPAAAELARYEGRFYALPNGLDIRALYYNRTWLDQAGQKVPQTLEELDELANELTEHDDRGRVLRFGYVPDPRRLWAWGTVFGGEFYDDARGQVTPTDPHVVEALAWMSTYRRRFGARPIAAFRQGDQTLPGAAFPLFPLEDPVRGRYAMIMDGQWRVRDIAQWQADLQRRGRPRVEFGVAPLPPPPGGRPRAGWVNANFFLLPRGGRNRAGAWEFMKFWSGFGGHESAAASACAAGGWIPVSRHVVEQPEFEEFLQTHPLFRTFVELAASPQQRPIPVIPAASAYDRALRSAATATLYDDAAPPPAELLKRAEQQVQMAVERARRRGAGDHATANSATANSATRAGEPQP